MNVFVKIIASDGHKPRRQARRRRNPLRWRRSRWPEAGRIRRLGRRDGNGQNVTFPARQYTVDGERRSFTLLRAIEEPGRPGACA